MSVDVQSIPHRQPFVQDDNDNASVTSIVREVDSDGDNEMAEVPPAEEDGDLAEGEERAGIDSDNDPDEMTSDDDEEKQEREKMLRQGAEARVTLNEGGYTAPEPTILKMYQAVYSDILGKWWKGKMDVQQANSTNDLIRRHNVDAGRPENTHLFPTKFIADNIAELNKACLHLLPLIDERFLKLRKNNDVDKFIKLVEPFLDRVADTTKLLNQKGIPFTAITPADAMKRLLDVIEVAKFANANSEKINEALRQMNEPHADQKRQIRHLKEAVEKTLNDPKNKDLAKSSIKTIEKINKDIVAYNKEQKIPENQHTFETGLVKSLVGALTKDKRERTANLQKVVPQYIRQIQDNGLLMLEMPEPVQRIVDEEQSKISLRRSKPETLSDNRRLAIEKAPEETKTMEPVPGEPQVKAQITQPSSNKKESELKLKPRPKPKTEPSQKASEESLFVRSKGRKVVLDQDGDKAGANDLKVRSLKPPKVSTGITPLGKIMSVRPAGRGGCRVFVNIGTEKHQCFKIFSGSDFGKGTRVAKELLQESKFEQKPGVSMNKRDEDQLDDIIGCVQVAEGPVKPKITRLGNLIEGRVKSPPAYFLARWKDSHSENPFAKTHPLQEWLTLSQVSTLWGHKWVSETLLPNALDEMEDEEKYLANKRKALLHPDTSKPLLAEDKKNQPWLYPQKRRTTSKYDGGKLSSEQQHSATKSKQRLANTKEETTKPNTGPKNPKKGARKLKGGKTPQSKLASKKEEDGKQKKKTKKKNKKQEQPKKKKLRMKEDDDSNTEAESDSASDSASASDSSSASASGSTLGSASDSASDSGSASSANSASVADSESDSD